MQYLCKAGQQVRAKAQDSAPDKDRMPLLGAPSLAGQASTGSANTAAKSGKDITPECNGFYIMK